MKLGFASRICAYRLPHTPPRRLSGSVPRVPWIPCVCIRKAVAQCQGSYLHVTRQGEIFPEGVSFKAVICQDPPEIRVVGKEDSKHVPDLEGRGSQAPGCQGQTQQCLCPVLSSSSAGQALGRVPGSGTHLPLVPVGGLVHRDNRLHRRQLICVGLHPDPGVEA